jgi:uncharacterized protein (DUF58 family)
MKENSTAATEQPTPVKKISAYAGKLVKVGQFVGQQLEERYHFKQVIWIPSLFDSSRAFRFLWSGLVLILITAVLGIVAIQTSAGLLYMLLGLFLGSWIVSGLFSWLNLAGLTVDREVTASSQVGEKMRLTYVITNHKKYFCSYSLVIEELGRLPMSLPAAFAMSLKPGEQLRIPVTVTCQRRGHMLLRRVRISSRYPFGLVAKCVVVKVAADIVVHPAIGSIRHHLFDNRTASAAGSMGQYNQQTKGFEEYYGIREYQSCDNIHWIHWRSSARTGKLMVKEMAEYNSNHVTILLDTRVEDPLSLEQQMQLEKSISFAATIIDRATERSLPVALVVSGGDIKLVQHGRGLAHRWGLMTELAAVRMGSWKAELPNLGSFRPRSFTDAHYWVIGVGVSQHLGELGVQRGNVTVIDTLSEEFENMFTVELPGQLAGRFHKAVSLS